MSHFHTLSIFLIRGNVDLRRKPKINGLNKAEVLRRITNCPHANTDSSLLNI